MKVAAVGDLQLGAGSTLTDDRLAEQAAMWRWVCTTAYELGADALLVCGDIWHRYPPTPAELLTFRNGLELHTLCIPGNHDSGGADRPTGLHVYDELLGLEVLDRPGWRKVGDGVVAALPWTPVSRLAAGAGLTGRDDVNADVASLLIDTARGLRAEIGEIDGPVVLMAHWSVSGSTFADGRSITDFMREPVLPLGELVDCGYDAVVLGHIHHQQLLCNSPDGPWVGYLGSPWVCDWSEANDEHGFWLLEWAEDRHLRVDYLPVPDRQFVTLEMSDVVSGCPIENGAVVRVRYRATAAEARTIDDGAAVRALMENGAHKVVVKPEIIREDRARVEVGDENLDPMQALELGFEALEVDEETAEAIRRLTAGYLGRVIA